jgi:heme-degrading monooxygenase HmoA
MIQVVWEFDVKDEHRTDFELAYGPGGAWSDLFSKAPGFRGTVLLRDTTNPLRYLTIDTWDSEAQREAMLAESADAYATLDASFRDWTTAESELGTFRMMAEASIRPQSVGRPEARTPRRRTPRR